MQNDVCSWIMSIHVILNVSSVKLFQYVQLWTFQVTTSVTTIIMAINNQVGEMHEDTKKDHNIR